jgi:RNA polymerase sigma-70 factor (ECF subfamily)
MNWTVPSRFVKKTGMMDQYQTRYTLLRRASDSNDEAAWEDIVSHYRNFIIYMLRKMNVPQNDIEDVAQQILMLLVRDIGQYDRERARFRSWLGSVIRNATLNYFRRQQARAVRMCSVNPDMDVLGTTHPAEIDVQIEREWAVYVGKLAMERTRTVFQGQAVEVFEMGLEGMAAADIAKQTGLSVSSVYTLRKRVKARVYREIRDVAAELERG